MSVAFGECVFDPDRHELFRAGCQVHLTPKAYQLLDLLVTNSPRAVSKGEIHERLWPATFVSEVNLAALVFEVRAAIGDSARRPRHLRTVRGFGYAFEGDPAERPAPTPGALLNEQRLLWGDREVSLRQGENVLGRTPEAVLWLDSPTISRRHARVLVNGDEATLEDLASKNGTFVRGRRVTSPTRLQDGDEIRVGSVRLTFRVFGGLGSTKTESGE